VDTLYVAFRKIHHELAGGEMRYLVIITVTLLFLGLSGCGYFFGKGESNMKSKSDARLELLEEYKECLDEAEDEVRAMDCDSYLKAADNV